MKWKRTGLKDSYCRIEGMDPCADWVLGPGFGDFSRGDNDVLIPFTIGPLDTEMVGLMHSFHDPEALREGRKSGVFVPGLYHDATETERMIGFVKKSVFDDLAGGGGPFSKILKTTKHIDLSLPLDPKSLPEHWKGDAPLKPAADLPVFQPPDGWPESTVVIGIIDDGIAFAHERFRLPDNTTRVQYVWRQDGIFDNEGSTVDFGSEICKENGRLPGIDSLLNTHCQAGLVDEEGLYRQAGLIDFRDPDHKAAAWRLSHGTHVLDLAAGYPPDRQRLDRPIIAVQLPVAVTADTSGSNLKTFAKAAMNYIVDRADRLAGKGWRPDGEWKPFPIVINFSYGMIAGPHDGTLDLEQAMDKLVAGRDPPVRIVLPAGNSNLSRCHAELEFEKPGETACLHWRVQPDDQTPTLMEIWLPHDGDKPGEGKVSIRIRTPSGLQSPRLEDSPGAGVRLLSDGDVLACAHYCFRPTPTERGVFVVSLQPTARLLPPDNPAASTATAPAGVWEISVTNTGLNPGEKVEAWIQWDDVIYGYSRRGRQSYFEDSCYQRFHPITGDLADVDDKDNPCIVKRAGLLNTIATGDKTIVVGGVQQKDLLPPKYTAGGPAVHRQGADVACVSDDSRIHTGILGAGSHSGSNVALSGTSVATPQIVRLVANRLADREPSDRDAIKAIAAKEEKDRRPPKPAKPSLVGEKKPPPPPPPPSKERAGSGRIVAVRRDWPDRFEADAPDVAVAPHLIIGRKE